MFDTFRKGVHIQIFEVQLYCGIDFQRSIQHHIKIQDLQTTILGLLCFYSTPATMRDESAQHWFGGM